MYINNAYPTMPQTTGQVRVYLPNGSSLVLADVNEAFHYILKNQNYSVSYALNYGGWRCTEL